MQERVEAGGRVLVRGPESSHGGVGSWVLRWLLAVGELEVGEDEGVYTAVNHSVQSSPSVQSIMAAAAVKAMQTLIYLAMQMRKRKRYARASGEKSDSTRLPSSLCYAMLCARAHVESSSLVRLPVSA